MKNRKKSKNLVICPLNKQFTDLIVCAASCEHKCSIYKATISYEMLLEYINEHPEYKISGEIMPTAKTVSKQEEKKYWILNDEKKVEEVSEEQIMENPQLYLDKQIWQKPPFKFEIVITLKRVKAD
ncbi:MAG: hypothetical protein JW996_02340 [Candidatus Cloacimonetes bacterium]|nr:hypothetical protein [Candidatus Cloacimonadota bacterium]